MAEINGLGTDDNCPVPEHTAEEHDILVRLLMAVNLSKGILQNMAKVRDENDGRMPVMP